MRSLSRSRSRSSSSCSFAVAAAAVAAAAVAAAVAVAAAAAAVAAAAVVAAAAAVAAVKMEAGSGQNVTGIKSTSGFQFSGVGCRQGLPRFARLRFRDASDAFSWRLPHNLFFPRKGHPEQQHKIRRRALTDTRGAEWTATQRATARPPCLARPTRAPPTHQSQFSEKPGPGNLAAPKFADRKSLREFRPALDSLFFANVSSGARAPDRGKSGRNSLRDFLPAKFGAAWFRVPRFSEIAALAGAPNAQSRGGRKSGGGHGPRSSHRVPWTRRRT